MEKASARRLIAEGYATELLEYFRSLSSAQMNAFLAEASRSAYLLCSFINILNRSSGAISNPDSIADLASGILDNTSANALPNRYYQVQLIDINTLNLEDSACNTPAPYNFGGANSSRRFLVTVWTTWVNPGQAANQAQNVAMSVMLSESP